MKSSKRWFWLGLAGVILLGLVLLAIAPVSNPRTQGSSFSRFPDGYGAWYAYMENQGVDIQRWQRPPEALMAEALMAEAPMAEATMVPMTLLQVMPPGVTPFIGTWNDWIAQGNTLIILGVSQPATEAVFSSQISSASGEVQIDTRRRRSPTLINNQDNLLGDRYGAVVWQQAIGEGQLIQASTPHLAANAYQDAPGNFAFLADLATRSGQTIWVDEYLHGYEQLTPEDEQAAGIISPRSWSMYLAETPWLLVVVQAIALTLALLWGFRRLGTPIALPTPVANNSEAYITALASVLRQAKSTGFVIEMVAKAERLQLQKQLGLGSSPVPDETLVATWAKQTGHTPNTLTRWLRLGQRAIASGRQSSSLSEQELVDWLQTTRKLRSDPPP
ncbi:MAG: DUF4350 domain-containing protein [Cyanothece sp. SIO2G6]|nr:DUF4350 domain-containing protein [Cyanothece sp. SIO2G6]